MDPVILHVGPVKTGSTFIQHLLWRNRGELAQQGVLHPCSHENEMWLAANDVQSEAFIHFDLPECRGSWATVVDRVRGHCGPSIMSHELLGFSTDMHVRRIVMDLAPRQLRIVVHARSLASILPSTYQEKVKMVDPDIAWDDWLGRQRDSRAGWSDAAAIVTRWAQYVPAEDIHVVTVPAVTADPSLLLSRFAAAAGVETRLWSIEDVAANASLDLDQTELLRRVNKISAGTMDVSARRRLVNDIVIPRLGTPSPDRRRRISCTERTWIEAETNRRVAALAASNAHVHGDLADLDAPDSAWTDLPTQVDQERLTDLAIRALIDASGAVPPQPNVKGLD